MTNMRYESDQIFGPSNYFPPFPSFFPFSFTEGKFSFSKMFKPLFHPSPRLYFMTNAWRCHKNVRCFNRMSHIGIHCQMLEDVTYSRGADALNWDWRHQWVNICRIYEVHAALSEQLKTNETSYNRQKQNNWHNTQKMSWQIFAQFNDF